MRMTKRGIKPEEFQDRIIFMSMYNDMEWSKGRDYARRLKKEHWSFLGPGDDENGVERASANLEESGIAPQM